MAQIWIGVVDLQSSPGSDFFRGAPGVFCITLCPAQNVVEYRHKVQAMFADMELEVRGFEDIEPFEEMLTPGTPVD